MGLILIFLFSTGSNAHWCKRWRKSSTVVGLPLLEGLILKCDSHKKQKRNKAILMCHYNPFTLLLEKQEICLWTSGYNWLWFKYFKYLSLFTDTTASTICNTVGVQKYKIGTVKWVPPKKQKKKLIDGGPWFMKKGEKKNERKIRKITNNKKTKEKKYI